LSKAIKHGHEEIYHLAEQSGKEASCDEFKNDYLTRYPWVNKKNINRMFLQGMFYAWKDMVL